MCVNYPVLFFFNIKIETFCRLKVKFQVDEQTKELATEKKKADVLLSRMLPRYLFKFFALFLNNDKFQASC